MEAKPESRSSRKGIILQEAARLFREKGYRASTLRELARRSGVQGGSIYYHFASKQEILYRIMDGTMSRLLQGLEHALQRKRDPVHGLRKGIEFHIRYHLENQDEAHVTDTELINLTEDHQAQVLLKRKRYEQAFMGILSEGVESGLMKVGDVKLVSIAVLQMCTAIPHWFDQEGPLSVEDIVTRYIDFIFWGVLGRAKGG